MLAESADAAGQRGTYHSGASDHPIKKTVPGGPGLTLCGRVENKRIVSRAPERAAPRPD